MSMMNMNTANYTTFRCFLINGYITGSVQFFRIPTRLSDEEKGHRIALFKELNIILGEEYKKSKQLKETRGKNTITKGGKTVSYSGDRSIILDQVKLKSLEILLQQVKKHK